MQHLHSKRSASSVDRIIRCHQGSTFIEVQVAMILLAVGLSGLVPIVVVQSRQSQRLALRSSPDHIQYLQPASSKWAQKLGVSASVSDSSADQTPKLHPQVLDDDSPGTTIQQQGSYYWSRYDFAPGYGGQILLTYGTNDKDYVQWRYTDLAPGTYQVYATYYSWSVSASAATYLIMDGSTTRGTAIVDQRIVPNDHSLDGMPWKNLGTYTITSGTLRVRLRDTTSGYLCADAVWIEPRRNRVSVVNYSPLPEQGRASCNVQVQPGNEVYKSGPLSKGI